MTHCEKNDTNSNQLLTKLFISLTRSRSEDEGKTHTSQSILTHGACSPTTTSAPSLQSHFQVVPERARSHKLTPRWERRGVYSRGEKQEEDPGCEKFPRAVGERQAWRERALKRPEPNWFIILHMPMTICARTAPGSLPLSLLPSVSQQNQQDSC